VSCHCFLKRRFFLILSKMGEEQLEFIKATEEGKGVAPLTAERSV